MSKKVEKSTCPICGKKFVKKVSNQVYCSSKCKAVAKAAAKRKARKTSKPVSAPVKKSGKKSVAKKITEKVVLPKPPMKKSDVIVLVHGNDPYKKFGLALQIAIHEFGNILAATRHFTPKKGK